MQLPHLWGYEEALIPRADFGSVTYNKFRKTLQDAINSINKGSEEQNKAEINNDGLADIQPEKQKEGQQQGRTLERAESDLKRAKAELKALEEKQSKLNAQLEKNLKENQLDLLQGAKPQAMFDDKTEQQKIVDETKKEIEDKRKEVSGLESEVERLTDAQNQLEVPFSAGTKPNTKTISKKAFDGLINRLKKAFPNVKVFQDENTLKSKLKEFWVNLTDFSFIQQSVVDKFQNELSLLESAKSALKNGTNPETVRREYGWFLGKDGIWKKEIDTNGVSLKKDISEFKITPRSEKLGNIINFSQLLEYYPNLTNENVRFYKSDKDGDFGYTQIISGIPTIFININQNKNEQQFVRTILHETQHIILFRAFGRIAQSLGELQEKEYTRVREGTGRITLTDNERVRAETKAYDTYKSQFDEIETFDVSDRVKLTQQQRQETPPNIAISEKELRELGFYDIQFLRTKDGTIYGAKFPDGSIYINPNELNANTPIHEFGHIWEQAFGARFKAGVEILKQSAKGRALIEQVRNNPFYKKMTPEQIEREALVVAIGNKGEQLFGASNYEKMKQWMSDLFKTIKEKLGIKQKLTADETLENFTKGVVGELLGGKVLNEEIGKNILNLLNDKNEMNYGELNRQSEKIINGTAYIDRLSLEEEKGRRGGGKTNVEASIIVGAVESANRERQESELRSEIINRQESALKQYADDNKLRVDEKYIAKESLERLPSGFESNVYLSKDGITVTKFINYRILDNTAQGFLDNRISLFNYIFPDTKYTLKGFSINQETGGFQFAVEQPFVQGKNVDFNNSTEKEAFDKEMQKIGFNELAYGVYINKDHVLYDVKNGNVKITPEGNYRFIDIVTTLNDKKTNGNRKYGDGGVVETGV